MGGLLAAEAATDSSNAKDGSKRIIGMIAFDCPYLGMHPHVVITGIASLFPKKNDPSMKTETELNRHPSVRIVDRKETDHLHDNSPSRPHLNASSSSSLSSNSSSSARSTADSLIGRTMKFVSSHSDDALVRWARKHSDEPVAAGKRWVVEHFQFGSCMFDPSGLKDRYATLVAWNGLWVNYWTITVPKSKGHSNELTDKESSGRELLEDNDAALVESGIAESIGNTTLEKGLSKDEKEYKAMQKAALKATKTSKVKAGRHFVVLPTGVGAILGGGDQWENVIIAGVDDEVAAHCGLFIPGQNLDYDGFVKRVGLRIIDWCNNV
ncbi:hypothetical protein GYMLUDRAFT_47695 [Collybiopsis luxurians FD-317 M1]|uniref:Uncharacterized protein n=1 Tax=Collybiopsis luxurians FD-317 M1 TaxID=944289 RepID=A0A0D0CBT3_9AGAR|nr:hypothetical protein GYMLUDRAFT_47695 [Collybiopsis luxurians FD-317 M1]